MIVINVAYWISHSLGSGTIALIFGYLSSLPVLQHTVSPSLRSTLQLDNPRRTYC